MRMSVARGTMTLSGLALLLAAGGCGLDYSDLLSGGSEAIYFSVYNFYGKPVRVDVTYQDRDFVQHTLAVTHDDSLVIPASSRGTRTLNVDDITRESSSLVTLTFIFPDDGNVQVIVDIQRWRLPDDNRIRIAVLGTTEDLIDWFAEPI